MDKIASLEAIANAKKAHELQLQKIEQLIAGNIVDNPTAVSKMHCEFGKWLYDENNRLREILGEQFYDKLDVLHEEWHKEYFKIYNIFFAEQKKGLFKKVFGGRGISSLELDKAKLYCSDLKGITAKLQQALEASTRRLQALSESKFY